MWMSMLKPENTGNHSANSKKNKVLKTERIQNTER